MNPTRSALLILLLICVARALADGEDWQPPVPMPDQYDWIQLASGEWLKGEIVVLYKGILEFDSDELDMLSLDFEDIRQIRSARVLQVRMLGNIDRVGRLLMADGQVQVSDSEQVYQQAEVLTIAAGVPREINFWNAKLTLGANWREGNTEQAEANFQALVQRRTLQSRFVFDYMGNHNTIDQAVSANNHRANAVIDRFITHSFFARPAFMEYFRDPFQNIEHRGTLGTGVGYQLVDSARTDWSVSGGPAYQHTRFVEVEPGEDISQSTPALVGGTRLAIEITGNLDFNYAYQLQWVSREAGLYNHHMVTGFEVELTRLLDFDISLVWDRIQEPQPDAEGNVPQRDDWRLIIGLGFDF